MNARHPRLGKITAERIGSQPVFALAPVSPSLEFNFDDVRAKDYCKSETGCT
jgi:hypothetical protein